MQNTATIELDRTPKVDWRASRDTITEQLKRAGQLVLTDNSKPMAVIIDVNSSTVEETLTDLRRLRVQRIMKSAQDSAFKNGTSNMTLEEINEEIASMRTERKTGEDSV